GARVLHLISAHLLTEVATLGGAVQEVLNGQVLLIVPRQARAWSVNAKAARLRAVAEPETQKVVRGPREGLIEDLETNLTLVRKRLKTPALKIDCRSVGRRSNTELAVLHLEGVADPKVLAEVHARLNKIDIDGIMDSGELEQLIEDNTMSVFPQVGNTERPDNIAAALLNGRVAILVDNSPFALIVPNVLTDMLQSSDDYYERFQFSSLIRILRYVLAFVALLSPALYVAITTFHHEMIPTDLLTNLVHARAGVPFPTVIEAGLMELAFEALREAGLRLPKAVGQAVSIVGALIIGQAAVEAGLVSPIMVIVVAATGIASFTIPAFNGAVVTRMLKFPLLVAAGTMGLYGISMALAIIIIHLSSLRSFGVPYLSPLAPITISDWKDLIVRIPTWAMYQRPTFIAKGDLQRQSKSAAGVQPQKMK
ncbi:MAG: spore germination protein, partial [Eubacteriales bacterium]|nr:spore germination protein [Eubacteriales bacterium]